MKSLRLALLPLLAVILASCSAFRREGRTQAETLLVTGNYLDCRLLCELAQYRIKQPVILFSTDLDGSTQMFFLPTPQKPDINPADKFGDLITFVNPKRVVIVGGAAAVPEKYIEVAKSLSTVHIIDGHDPSKCAKELGFLLNQKRLHRDFDDFKARMNDRGISAN
ncbi:MAG: hypothetical protein J6866_00605 [Victivallales bacterium]|nr:hypothetical protein [Victivallales bacterium]